MSLTTVPPYRASVTLGFRFLDKRTLVVGPRFTGVGSGPKNVSTSTDTTERPRSPLRPMASSTSSRPTTIVTG